MNYSAISYRHHINDGYTLARRPNTYCMHTYFPHFNL